MSVVLQSPDGDLIDCVPSHQQPAFDPSKLKGQKPLVNAAPFFLRTFDLTLFVRCMLNRPVPMLIHSQESKGSFLRRRGVRIRSRLHRGARDRGAPPRTASSATAEVGRLDGGTCDQVKRNGRRGRSEARLVAVATGVGELVRRSAAIDVARREMSCKVSPTLMSVRNVGAGNCVRLELAGCFGPQFFACRPAKNM
jgi:hypothetical protein